MVPTHHHLPGLLPLLFGLVESMVIVVAIAVLSWEPWGHHSGGPWSADWVSGQISKLRKWHTIRGRVRPFLGRRYAYASLRLVESRSLREEGAVLPDLLQKEDRGAGTPVLSYGR